MDYLVVKWLHIVTSTLLLGTGLGIAFFMWMAHRRGDAHVIAATARNVVIADAWFTAPAVVIQLLTGIWLVNRLGMPLGTFWITGALLLFVVTGACWLPVLWLQVHARNLSQAATQTGTPLPARYHVTMRWWFWLGWPAFASVLGIFWLMVAKPV
jgi:uncharacterized membrane protein